MGASFTGITVEELAPMGRSYTDSTNVSVHPALAGVQFHQPFA